MKFTVRLILVQCKNEFITVINVQQCIFCFKMYHVLYLTVYFNIKMCMPFDKGFLFKAINPETITHTFSKISVILLGALFIKPSNKLFLKIHSWEAAVTKNKKNL